MDKVALIFITLTSCMIAIIVVVTVQCFCNKHYAVIKARCFSNTNKAANGASKEQDDSGKKLHRNEKYNKMNPKASSKPLLNKVTETFSRHKENDKESMSIELSPLDIKLVCKPRINKELSSESTLIEYISPETKENVCNKPIDRESSVELISIEELSAETKAMMSPADKNDQEILTKAEMITDTSAKIKLKLKESNTYVTLAAKPAFNYGHVISLADERRARQSGYENYMISKNTYVYEKFIYGKKDADELKTAIDNSPMPITEEMFPLGIEVTNDFEKERLSKLRACLSADIEKIYLYDTLEKSEKDFLKYFLDKDEHSYDLIVQLKRFLSKRQILE